MRPRESDGDLGDRMLSRLHPNLRDVLTAGQMVGGFVRTGYPSVRDTDYTATPGRWDSSFAPSPYPPAPREPSPVRAPRAINWGDDGASAPIGRHRPASIGSLLHDAAVFFVASILSSPLMFFVSMLAGAMVGMIYPDLTGPIAATMTIGVVAMIIHALIRHRRATTKCRYLVRTGIPVPIGPAPAPVPIGPAPAPAPIASDAPSARLVARSSVDELLRVGAMHGGVVGEDHRTTMSDDLHAGMATLAVERECARRGDVRDERRLDIEERPIVIAPRPPMAAPWQDESATAMRPAMTERRDATPTTPSAPSACRDSGVLPQVGHYCREDALFDRGLGRSMRTVEEVNKRARLRDEAMTAAPAPASAPEAPPAPATRPENVIEVEKQYSALCERMEEHEARVAREEHTGSMFHIPPSTRRRLRDEPDASEWCHPTGARTPSPVYVGEELLCQPADESDGTPARIVFVPNAEVSATAPPTAETPMGPPTPIEPAPMIDIETRTLIPIIAGESATAPPLVVAAIEISRGVTNDSADAPPAAPDAAL